MFRSNLFVKTFSTIVCGTVILAAIYYMFTVPMINSMAFEMEERAGKNVLDNMYMLVRQSGADLDSWRESAMNGHKRELRNIVAVVISYIRDVQEDIRANRISPEHGRKLVLERIRKLNYGNNDYVWVSDYHSRLIAHPDPELLNKDFSAVKDVHGNLIVPPMVKGAQEKGEGFYSYWWRRLGKKEPVEKLSFYKDVPEWEWVVGTGVYIDDITESVEKRKKELIEELRRHLRSIRIGVQGYIYIFDKNMNMIIHPNSNIENTNFSDLLDPVTGRPIGAELVAASETTSRQLHYKWDKPSDPNNYIYDKISWVRHFQDKNFDWYICASVYTSDLKRSAQALTSRIIIVSLITLVVSIIGGYFFVQSFTSPIKSLATIANRVSRGDLSTTVQLNREDEIGVLAKAFNNMVRQLNDQIRNLEERVAERTSELSEWVRALERRNSEIETINAMGDMLKACRTREEVNVVVAKTVKSLFPDSTGSLMMYYDSPRKELRKVISWNKEISTQEDAVYQADDCWGIRLGKTHVMDNSVLSQVCGHVEAVESNASPYICVPMIAQGEITGMLHICPAGEAGETGEARGRIGESDKRIAETVAEHSGLSLANIALQQTLQEQSIKDSLTGLFNRRYAAEVLRKEHYRAIRHNSCVGVFLLDVDHFKKVNDTHGHDAGDEVLRRLGEFLRREFREEDIPCRYGGEEFLVILPQTNRDICGSRAEELRLLVEKSLGIKWQGAPLEITVSIGVALFPDHGQEMQDVVDSADKALYEAKHRGRNQVVIAG